MHVTQACFTLPWGHRFLRIVHAKPPPRAAMWGGDRRVKGLGPVESRCFFIFGFPHGRTSRFSETQIFTPPPQFSRARTSAPGRRARVPFHFGSRPGGAAC